MAARLVPQLRRRVGRTARSISGRLGATGLWEGASRSRPIQRNYESVGGRPRPGVIDLKEIPLQPWAQALLDARHARYLADEPYTRCKPSPAARSFGTAYGIELMNIPGTDRIYLFQTGGAHSYRVIYIDGRTHPTSVEPSAFGHSIGWWEGDTLFIDTVGIDESAWLERWAMPHTDRLHTIERVTRLDLNTLKYELTVDDPGAYTAQWTSGYTLRWTPNLETFEYSLSGEQLWPADDGRRRRRRDAHEPRRPLGAHSTNAGAFGSFACVAMSCSIQSSALFCLMNVSIFFLDAADCSALNSNVGVLPVARSSG